MKQKTFNAISTGASGNFMDQVVMRNQNGKMTIAKVPGKSTKKLSPKAEQAQAKFQTALEYGTSVIGHPLLQQVYTDVVGDGKNIYSIAVTDYMKPPKIGAIRNVNYSGLPGGELMAVVTDDVQVTGVAFALYSSDGVLIESGPGVVLQNSGWGYTATQTNDTLTGTRVVITATDIPMNSSTKELVL